ncbi:gliding motility-associated C-terminal domain-containing protein [Flavobacterium rakeshii]|uniref:gliding motility-associated C-terminal domain-containing protein n=1 Tax=Flavobacterium rakeshii TaxID=1038845 RepID=UPI002E7BF20F|nr:gliding motility-associated C-terminal domain-containing protein [Flavobacterium rakeshii]MEE1896730.1 gliding motility-associated C-terminal domain-containing protein [Flavobacterium rakeshii]
MYGNFTQLKRLLFVLSLLLSCTATFAQLPSFTVSATATPQACLGNGSISLTVSGTNPSATIDYAVYLLPDTTNAVANTTSSTINSLEDGDYLIIATQSLGGESNTASTNITIADETEELSYSIAGTNIYCGNDGVLLINVVSGSGPFTYEIMSGPVTFPEQASNVFNNLPPGTYQVRVHDACGDADVVTHQLITAQPGFYMEDPGLDYTVLPSCDTVNIGFLYTNGGSNTEVFFPLVFQFTVYPPGGGAPIIVTENVASGDPTGINALTTEIPFYNDQEYTYDIQITDKCGNVFNHDDVEVDDTINFALFDNNLGCEEFIMTIAPSLYMPPFQVTFLSAPAGFVPANFNPSHPTFSTPEAVYGSFSNPLPMGSYSVQVTDACGNSVVQDIELTNEGEPSFLTSVNPTTCLGQIDIAFDARVLVGAEIIAAPDAYPNALPDDVSEFISDTGVLLTHMPIGTYTIVVTDACGDDYTLEIEITPSGADTGLTFDQLPGCALGYGSVKFFISGNNIATAEITSAPATFTETLPYDISFNVSDGQVYMNSLPAGNYTFTTIDNCGIEHVDSVLIEGYEDNLENIDIIPYCGSFDLQFSHTANSNFAVSYWLQKYDEATDMWGHPLTGSAYTEGGQPNGTNSKLIDNDDPNLNLPYLGHFRIIRVFFVYSNGMAPTTRCVSTIHEFDFDGQPKIVDIYSLPCGNDGMYVAVEAEGIAPLQYSITQPTVIDNGTDNVFASLTSGTYNFRVTDACGNFRNVQMDISDLEQVEIIGTGLCDGAEGQLAVSQFSFFTYEWWKEGAPNTILSTANLLDFTPFNSDTDAGTYYVKMTSTGGIECEQVLEYVVEPASAANAGDDDTVTYCNDEQPVNLSDFLSNPHDEGGTWTDVSGSGALSGDTLTTAGLAAGTYQFRYRVTDMCDNMDEAIIIVELRNIPDAPEADPVAAVCEGENVQLSATTVPNATYEWIGPDNFSSTDQNPMLTGAGMTANGTYQVRVLVDGCTSSFASVDVGIKESPDFTINGDTSLCEGQSGLLNVAPSNFDENAVTYQWYYESDLLDGVDAATIEIFEVGQYHVEVNNDGCVSEEVIQVNRNTNAFDVVLDNSCNDFEYVITVVNQGELEGATYSWAGPEGFNASGPEVVISEMAAGTYTVEVTNTDGCTAIASVDIENTYCRIPKGISPGNDGMNDTFDLSNLEVQELLIFNRYGLKVYEKEGYLNEWHGQSDKGDLPTGTYYYVATLSAGKQVTGWVYLNRQEN